MFGLMAPTSPESLRHETLWINSQGAPAVFKGDLYDYSIDHDVREKAHRIDPAQRSVDMLKGEYEGSGTPALGVALAALIPGARTRRWRGSVTFP